MTKHAPATPLPWKTDENDELPPAVIRDNEYGDGIAEVQGEQNDADYIAHAANAYPKLVEALRVIADRPPADDGEHAAEVNWIVATAAALLRELGEAE